MSLLDIPDNELKGIVRFYSKLIRKHPHNNSLRCLYVGRRRFYTKELDARGILWRKNGVEKK